MSLSIRSPHEKLLGLCKVRNRVEELKDEGKRIVFTNGCFDLFHVGHARLLWQARQLGDVLVVGVNSDFSVGLLKGETRPIITAAQRAEIIAGLECVDLVAIFRNPSAHAMIEAVVPDVYVKGGSMKEADIPEAALVRELGGEVVILPHLSERSTSAIIRHILATCPTEIAL